MRVIKRNGKDLLLENFIINEKFSEEIKSNDTIIFNCINCNKETSRKKSNFKVPVIDNLLCRNCSFKKTNIEKYGISSFTKTEEYRIKTKETNFKKYGTNSFTNTEEYKIKIKKSNLEKYGVDHISKLNIIKDRKKNTILEKYGTENISQNSDIKNRIKLKRLKNSFYKLLERNKNMVKPLFDIEDYIGIKYDNKYLWECLMCNKVFEDNLYAGNIPRCPICFPFLAGFSNKEKEVVEFIKSLNIDVVENYRDIFEIDIYIPSLNLGIEFDGIYWHSDIYKDRDYHLDKTNYFKNLGIDIIHIFEDEWNNKQDIVKSIIKSRLGMFDRVIYARKTEIKEVPPVEEKEFLETNHIQGYIPSSVCLGLYYNNELVSLMSFGKSRFNKNYEWELLRFANKLNTKIIGGASKLFKNINLTNIISYCDIRYFTGEIYRTLGFIEAESSKPNYYYTKNNERFSRIKYQKHKLKDLLENFDENLTEKENMFNNGFNRIYDCGMKVFNLEGK